MSCPVFGVFGLRPRQEPLFPRSTLLDNQHLHCSARTQGAVSGFHGRRTGPGPGPQPRGQERRRAHPNPLQIVGQSHAHGCSRRNGTPGRARVRPGGADDPGWTGSTHNLLANPMHSNASHLSYEAGVDFRHPEIGNAIRASLDGAAHGPAIALEPCERFQGGGRGPAGRPLAGTA